MPLAALDARCRQGAIDVSRHQKVRQLPGSFCVSRIGADANGEVDVALKFRRKPTDKHDIESGGENRSHGNDRQLGLPSGYSQRCLPSWNAHQPGRHLVRNSQALQQTGEVAAAGSVSGVGDDLALFNAFSNASKDPISSGRLPALAATPIAIRPNVT